MISPKSIAVLVALAFIRWSLAFCRCTSFLEGNVHGANIPSSKLDPIESVINPRPILEIQVSDFERQHLPAAEMAELSHGRYLTTEIGT